MKVEGRDEARRIEEPSGLTSLLKDGMVKADVYV